VNFDPLKGVNCEVSETQTFSRIGKKHYLIGKSKVSWFDALHLCRRFGGDLALIESSEEMNVLSTYLRNQGYDASAWIWISGNDLVTNLNFQSVTNGLPLPYTNWSPGQPDVPIEHCMHLWLQNGEFQMNNWLCDQKAYYICQRQTNTRCSDD